MGRFITVPKCLLVLGIQVALAVILLAGRGTEEPENPSTLMTCGTEDMGWTRIENPARDRRADTVAIDAALALEPGMVVVDVGAGRGYWSFRMADEMGDTGLVYATEVTPSCVDSIRDTCEEEQVDNVLAQISSEDSLDLENTKADRILFVNSKTFFSPSLDNSSNKDYVEEIWETLVPGGRVVMFGGIEKVNCLPAHELLAVFEEVGFEIISESDPQTLYDPDGGVPPDERCRSFLVAE